MVETRLLDEEMPAVKIMRKWGSNARFSKALEKTHTTTDRWLVNGYVPGSEHGAVIAAARRDGIPIMPADFVDLRLFELEGTAA